MTPSERGPSGVGAADGFDYEELQRRWKWVVPRRFNIGRDCTDKWAALESHREKVALYFEDDRGREERYTFGELALLTNRAANALLSLGFRKGDRLVIRLPNLPAYPLVFLGALKAGIVPVPTSYMLTAEELAYIVEDCGAKGVLTVEALYDAVDDVRTASRSLAHVIVAEGRVPSSCVGLEALMARSPDVLDVPLTEAEDVAYMCYTSGTTGFPKGVVHAHRALIGRDPAARFWLALRPGDTVMHAGKLNWTYTLGTGCLDPWRHGCSAVIWGGEHDVESFFRLIAKYSVDLFMAVPTVYRHMLRSPGRGKADLATLRHALSAGEHLSEELFHAFRDRFGVELYDGLGMTEFSYYLSNMPGMPIKPGSPGKPQPGHRSVLLGEDCRPVPPGETGVLATPRDDPGVMLRYWGLPEESENRFCGPWFVSGDYFYTDEDGYYWIVGRKDDLITTFGYRVSPFEVERVLARHPAVAECAVAGIKVGFDKTIVAAFVVVKGSYGAGDDLRSDILTYLGRRLAHYKCPKELYFLDSIPKTMNGKVLRRELVERYSTYEEL